MKTSEAKGRNLRRQSLSFLCAPNRPPYPKTNDPTVSGFTFLSGYTDHLFHSSYNWLQGSSFCMPWMLTYRISHTFSLVKYLSFVSLSNQRRASYTENIPTITWTENPPLSFLLYWMKTSFQNVDVCYLTWSPEIILLNCVTRISVVQNKVQCDLWRKQVWLHTDVWMECSHS